MLVRSDVMPPTLLDHVSSVCPEASLRSQEDAGSATMHALRHEAYRERYQRNKKRLGRQRGAKVAQIDIARKLAEAIWHMLTHQQPFNPNTSQAAGGAAFVLAA